MYLCRQGGVRLLKGDQVSISHFDVGRRDAGLGRDEGVQELVGDLDQFSGQGKRQKRVHGLLRGVVGLDGGQDRRVDLGDGGENVSDLLLLGRSVAGGVGGLGSG